MITAFRDGKNFMVRVDLHDQASNLYNTNYITLTWSDANDLQTALSQLLLDFEIERGAYPISDEDDYMLDRHTTGEPF